MEYSLMDCVIYSLIGFCVVFGVLVLIAIGTTLLSKFILALENKPKKE